LTELEHALSAVAPNTKQVAVINGFSARFDLRTSGSRVSIATIPPAGFIRVPWSYRNVNAKASATCWGTAGGRRWLGSFIGWMIGGAGKCIKNPVRWQSACHERCFVVHIGERLQSRQQARIDLAQSSIGIES
jgi:hypothetical protein